MAMEFLDSSQKLSARVKVGGPLLSDVSMAVLRNLTSAVVYLHGIAICHRDVKPENVLCVGESGDVRLIDFNSARTDAGAYECLSPSGDLTFSAPEVVREGASFEADIWGIGATLYFAASAHFEWRHSLFQEAVWNTVPASLKRPITACLAIDPASRPTAEALWKELGSEVEKNSSSSTPKSSECTTPTVVPT
jgi:serine/threonine protein kinase